MAGQTDAEVKNKHGSGFHGRSIPVLKLGFISPLAYNVGQLQESVSQTPEDRCSARLTPVFVFQGSVLRGGPG